MNRPPLRRRIRLGDWTAQRCRPVAMVGMMAALCMAVGAARPARAETLRSLLAQGPVVMVEQADGGALRRITALIHIPASAQAVWDVVVDLGRYVDFVPKVIRSEVVTRHADGLSVAFEVEAPGANPTYTMRYRLRPEQRVIQADWEAGDLRGNSWNWLLVPQEDGGTVIYYRGLTPRFSAFLQAIEDDQQTVTMGVNVGAAIALLKAIRQEVARRGAAPQSPPPPARASP